MNQQQYLSFHDEICTEARKLSQAKNNDYSAPETRQHERYPAFANFLQAERLGICSVEAGIMVRLSDKMSRLANLIRPGHERAVHDERIHDTILDGINYLCILAAYLDSKAIEAKEDGQ